MIRLNEVISNISYFKMNSESDVASGIDVQNYFTTSELLLIVASTFSLERQALKVQKYKRLRICPNIISVYH